MIHITVTQNVHTLSSTHQRGSLFFITLGGRLLPLAIFKFVCQGFRVCVSTVTWMRASALELERQCTGNTHKGHSKLGVKLQVSVSDRNLHFVQRFLRISSAPICLCSILTAFLLLVLTSERLLNWIKHWKVQKNTVYWDETQPANFGVIPFVKQQNNS